jgi:hypothetical protein
MVVVLDTNIIQQDYFIKSSRFTVLLDYPHRTHSQIALPKLVLDELRGNLKRDNDASITPRVAAKILF